MGKIIAQSSTIRFGDDEPHVVFNLTPDKIKFKLDIKGTRSSHIDLENPDAEPTLVPYEHNQEDFEISLETFKSVPNFKTNTYYGIGTADSFSGGELSTRHIFNVSEITKTQRALDPNNARLPALKVDLYVSVFVKDPNGSFTDWDIVVFLPSNIQSQNITSNVNFETPDNFSHVNLVDAITITEDTDYINSDYDKFTVTTEPYVDEVFLEPVAGIIDKIRVPVSNGNGSFRVLKSSVESGQEFKVKAGFYSYVGIAKFSKTY